MTKNCPKGFSVCFCNPDRPICKPDKKKSKKLGVVSGGFMTDNKKFGTSKKPNLRLKAKKDLVNEYLDKKRISATIYNKFMEHLHHHTKAHIKSMLVQIHRKKKSFDNSHKFAIAKFEK